MDLRKSLMSWNTLASSHNSVDLVIQGKNALTLDLRKIFMKRIREEYRIDWVEHL